MDNNVCVRINVENLCFKVCMSECACVCVCEWV